MAERVVKLNLRRHWYAWSLLIALVIVAACSQVFGWSYKLAVPIAAGILLVWLLIAGIYLLLRFMVNLARRRRWIALAVVLGATVWLLSFPRNCFIQWRAVHAILKADGSVTFDGDFVPTNRNAPRRGFPGREAIERIIEARIPAEKHPELRYYVACLDGLKRLNLSVATGADAYGLKKLRKLEQLTLRVACKPDVALGFLGRLDQLKRLWVRSDEKVTDDGVRHLAELSQLEDLDIRPSAITDSGIAALQSLPLKFLHLSQSEITDAGLRKMHQMPLVALYVEDTHVTTKGIQELRAKNARVIIEPVGMPDAPEEADAVKKLQQRGFKLTPDETGHIVTVQQWGKVEKQFLENEPSFDEICGLLAQLQNVQYLSTP